MIVLLENSESSPRFTIAKVQDLMRKYPGVGLRGDCEWCRFAEVVAGNGDLFLLVTDSAGDTIDEVEPPVEYDSKGYPVQRFLNVYSPRSYYYDTEDDRYKFLLMAEYEIDPSKFREVGAKIATALQRLTDKDQYCKDVIRKLPAEGLREAWE